MKNVRNSRTISFQVRICIIDKDRSSIQIDPVQENLMKFILYVLNDP